MNGREIPSPTVHGERIVDDSFLLLFNAHHEPCEFVLPPVRYGRRWILELSTEDPDAAPVEHPARARVSMESRSILVLRRGG
jgi:glycogen operon protein